MNEPKRCSVCGERAKYSVHRRTGVRPDDETIPRYLCSDCIRGRNSLVVSRLDGRPRILYGDPRNRRSHAEE